MKLLNCAHCGEEAEFEEYVGEHSGKWFYVRCRSILRGGSCGVTSGMMATKAEAEKIWNARAGGWRPIESVPKDGTKILLRYPSGDIISSRWHEDYEDYWDYATNDIFVETYDDPIAWMPIPEFNDTIT